MLSCASAMLLRPSRHLCIRTRKVTYAPSRGFAILSPQLAGSGVTAPGPVSSVRHRGTDMKIFFSVGEPSGDLHGANLIRELRRLHSHGEFVGYGGPRMAAAGCQLHADLTELAVMWFLRALMHLPRFWQLVCQADRYFRHQRPDAVILIDYPGFNWWIARRAKAHRIPVFYYGAPQMWAWAGWRVGKMRRLVDHVLCKLPFEADWYRQRGCDATYVGHPYFDEMAQQALDAAFVAGQAHRTRPIDHDPPRLAHTRSRSESGGLPVHRRARTGRSTGRSLRDRGL